MALTVVMAGMVLMSFFYVLTSLYYGRDITFPGEPDRHLSDDLRGKAE